MFFLDWLYGILASLGLWQKEAKILFLGLDSARKATFLHMLKDDITCRVWKDYYAKVDPAVYLVDAYDKERFAESKKELNALLSDDALMNVESHSSSCATRSTYPVQHLRMSSHLGLTNFTTGKGKVILSDTNVRPLEVFMCSIVQKMGYGDGFRWLSQYIK